MGKLPLALNALLVAVVATVSGGCSSPPRAWGYADLEPMRVWAGLEELAVRDAGGAPDTADRPSSSGPRRFQILDVPYELVVEADVLSSGDGANVALKVVSSPSGVMRRHPNWEYLVAALLEERLGASLLRTEASGVGKESTSVVIGQLASERLVERERARLELARRITKEIGESGTDEMAATPTMRAVAAGIASDNFMVSVGSVMVLARLGDKGIPGIIIGLRSGRLREDEGGKWLALILTSGTALGGNYCIAAKPPGLKFPGLNHEGFASQDSALIHVNDKTGKWDSMGVEVTLTGWGGERVRYLLARRKGRRRIWYIVRASRQVGDDWADVRLKGPWPEKGLPVLSVYEERLARWFDRLTGGRYELGAYRE